MILRLFIILAMAFQTTPLVVASACGDSSQIGHADAAHVCGCGDACPAIAPTPSMCGCCATDEEPAPLAPPAPEVRVQLGLAPTVQTLQLPTIPRCTAPHGANERSTRSAVSFNALYCTWLT